MRRDWPVEGWPYLLHQPSGVKIFENPEGHIEQSPSLQRMLELTVRGVYRALKLCQPFCTGASFGDIELRCKASEA